MEIKNSCFQQVIESFRDSLKTITILTSVSPLNGKIIDVCRDYLKIKLLKENMWYDLYIPINSIIAIEDSEEVKEYEES